MTGVARIFLIGGGDMMHLAARGAAARGLAATAVLAPRHADEPLLLFDGTLAEALASSGTPTRVVEDINDPAAFAALAVGPRAAAICFGPAWIFSARVHAGFEFGMFNVNAIPVPRYLGGAHYTWQIMNGDRRGGVAVQRIEGRIDRGPVIQRIEFDLPDDARTPADYFRHYLRAAVPAIDGLLTALREGDVPSGVPFADLEKDRAYFPRLLTKEHGFVDWRWSARDIERFCMAFDDPYMGAATFAEGRELRLKSVRRVPEDFPVHPFAFGLVVRNLGKPVVAAAGGWLEIGGVCWADGADAAPSLKEGARLHTPSDVLDRAMGYRVRFGPKGVV